MTPPCAKIPNLSSQPLAGGDCICHEHRNRHRTDASGNRCDRLALGSHGIEVDIADEAIAVLSGGILETVDPDINDDGTLANVLGAERASESLAARRVTAVRSFVRE